MSPAEAATSLGRAVGTLRRGSAGHHARPVVLAAAGIGLAAVWATARRGPRDARAQVGLEEALRTHARELARFAARLTDVADAERRRIERDLHDGCQQRLICLRMKLALAERLVGDENDSAAKLIHEITDGAESALEDLEALVQRHVTSHAPRHCRTPQSTPAAPRQHVSRCATGAPGSRSRSTTTAADSPMQPPAEADWPTCRTASAPSPDSCGSPQRQVAAPPFRAGWVGSSPWARRSTASGMVHSGDLAGEQLVACGVQGTRHASDEPTTTRNRPDAQRCSSRDDVAPAELISWKS